LNEWLAKDVATVTCFGNTNHLSSQIKISLVRPRDEIPTDKINGKMLIVYTEDFGAHRKQVSSAAGNRTF